jgi:bifunctional DNA-binding transcriptional regulator/antitoxin component of YhaV-PrlF toxin-antitoxin module
MRITAKGQVTIPLRLGEALGLLPETEVEFERVGDSVRIRKVRSRSQRGRHSLPICAVAPTSS